MRSVRNEPMRIVLDRKDKNALSKTLSNVCTNLSAGWFGFILIVPGFSPPQSLDDWFILTKSVSFGIVFMWLAYKLERMSK